MIHGFEGIPNGGWRPWLMRELANKGIFATALSMPTPGTPKKDEWISEINHAVNLFPDNDIVLVGHSLGGPAILNYLQSSNRKIKGVFLVASPIRSTGFDYAPKMATFYEKPFEFEKIKSMSDNFIIIHGDNDPFVPFSHAESMSQELGVPVISIKNGAHLNTEAGCFELPELRDAILSITK